MANSENLSSPFRMGRFVILFAALFLFVGINPYTYAVNLPETGQNTCYS